MIVLFYSVIRLDPVVNLLNASRQLGDRIQDEMSPAANIRSRTSFFRDSHSSAGRLLYSSSLTPISLLPVTIPTLHTLRSRPP